MDMPLLIAALLGGLTLLAVGGDVLVRGASGLALKAGVTPLVVGLVVVGLGTSMPELVTSVEAVMSGAPGIAWGNIAGSNLANTFLILGAVIVIAPIVPHGSARLRDPLVALALSVLVFAISWFAIGSVLVGVAMVALLLAYIAFAYFSEKGHEKDTEWHLDDPELEAPPPDWLRPIAFLVVGLIMLVIGGRLLVSGAIDLARLAGMSETLIGVSVVAIGTSLPELAASVAAALKKQGGIALGNVIGSNIYNLLAIGGATMILAPIAPPAELNMPEWPLVVGSAVILAVACAFLAKLGRALGIALLAAYTAYIGYLITLI